MAENQNNYISKVQLSGGVYHIKDAEARAMISGKWGFIVAWSGTGTPVAANIPAGVTVKYKDGDKTKTVTGTLVASKDTRGKFYLVKNSTVDESKNIYNEYVTVNVEDSDTYSWEKLGDTQVNIDNLGQLAYKNSVQLVPDTDSVLGTDTSFTASDSEVTFTGTTSDTVLGEDTQFTATPNNGVNISAALNAAPTIANSEIAYAITGFDPHSTDKVLGEGTGFVVTPTAEYISATTTVTHEVSDTKNALGEGAEFTTSATISDKHLDLSYTPATVVKSYPGVTSNLVTGTVHDTPTLNTKYLATTKVLTSASAETSKMVTASASVLTAIDNPKSISQVSYVDANASEVFVDQSVEGNESYGNSTWSFKVDPDSSSETNHDFTLVISGHNSRIRSEARSVSKVSDATPITTTDLFTTGTFTYATGSLSSNGGGAAVAYNVTIGSQAYVATGQLLDNADEGNGAAVGVSLTAGTAYTFATGTIASDGTGSAVLTGLGTAVTADVVSADIALTNTGNTGIAFVESVSNLSTVTNKKDTVAAITSLGNINASTELHNADASTTGAVSVIKSVSVSANKDNLVDAITGLGTAQTAEVLKSFTLDTPTITVTNGENVLNTSSTIAVTAGAENRVGVITSIGTATAAAQTINVTKDNVEVLTSETGIKVN